MDRLRMPLFVSMALALGSAVASAQTLPADAATVSAPTSATSIVMPASASTSRAMPASTTTLASPATTSMPDAVVLPASTSTIATPTEAEQDFADIYGQYADPNLPDPAALPVAFDPWEGFNRRVHTFNNAVDRAVAKPLAKAYIAVVPRPLRLGVSNFFANLGQPLTAINALLQGKPKVAAQALGRFALNSTLGIGGLFDPASDAKLPAHHEDFGQTLGTWGWARSRYVEVPFFGPRTVRDLFGMGGDSQFALLRGIEDDKTRIFLQGLQLVDVRTQLLSLDSMREGASDDYVLVRDAWLQRRQYQIFGDRQQDDEGLPEYLQDDEGNPTVPVDAIPVTPLDGG